MVAAADLKDTVARAVREEREAKAGATDVMEAAADAEDNVPSAPAARSDR